MRFSTIPFFRLLLLCQLPSYRCTACPATFAAAKTKPKQTNIQKKKKKGYVVYPKYHIPSIDLC